MNKDALLIYEQYLNTTQPSKEVEENNEEKTASDVSAKDISVEEDSEKTGPSAITKKHPQFKTAHAGKTIGKKKHNFKKIMQKAGKEYHSKEAGARVAGAILAKMRARR